ncbi:MAG: ABC transporter ATP-binding protein [Spirochaetales bacterium]
MSLNLHGVSFRYATSTRNVLEDISLTVEAGQVTVLLGANGSGKSTLLSLACGRLSPARGEAHADGRALASLTDQQRARTLAFLPQAERVPFAFTCLEFALFGSAHRRAPFSFASADDADAARRAFADLGLEALETRPVTEVSLGELQLVRLVRCVVQDAPWLLLDEPTAMLDPAHVRAVGSALRQLATSGRGILLSTHDLGFARLVADTAFALSGGKVIASGPAAEVLVPAVLERTYGVPLG